MRTSGLRRLRGWAYRIRTGKSVRELSDWNFVTTSPEVVQARRRRPFALELRCTNLQLRRIFSSLAGYYGDYSLAALEDSTRRNSASAPSRECVIETSRDDLRFGHGSAFEPCEQLANVVRRAHRHHSQTFMRPSGAVMLLFVREAEGQVVQVQSTDQCELATPPCCRAAARV